MLLKKSTDLKKSLSKYHDISFIELEFNGYEFEQTLGDSGGQRNMACYSP